jgi:hypothetical protein
MQSESRGRRCESRNVRPQPSASASRSGWALRDPRPKKIYVYAEGSFVLHNAAEVHKIVIKTPAFDVAGWIDLSSMAPGGDELFTEVHVSFANRTNVL